MTPPPTIVYPAKSITTMNRLAPSAEVIAVSGDRIAAVGSREAVIAGLKLSRREYRVDETFADAALLPGLIEAHSHITSSGAFYQMPAYVGAYPRPGVGGMLKPCATKSEVLSRLRDVAPSVTGPVTAWGYDPTLIDGRPTLTAADLDGVDPTRPVVVVNMSGHIAYCNTTALGLAGYDDSTDLSGVVKDAAGRLTGELHELPAMMPLLGAIMKFDPESLARGVAVTADFAHRRGLTTISDLLTQSPAEVRAMSAYARSDTAKTRMASYYSYFSLARMGADNSLTFLDDLCSGNDDHFRLAGVKFVTDGSIQGETAYLLNPPYYDGAPNGLFNFGADLADQLGPFHDAGHQIVLHANGDGAADLILTALTRVMDRSPRRDNRHRLDHAQLLTQQHIETMARYGISANVFSKHNKYWGDVDRTITLGPDLAAQMNPARTLIEAGVRISLHSDAWVTPIDQLESVVSATTRKTRSGFVLGPREAITVIQALRAVTIDAAFLLREDHMKGSIERGKLADITVLDRPINTAQDAEEAKPLATILGGRVLPIPSAG